jgi:CheY-like chemotaxis protein
MAFAGGWPDRLTRPVFAALSDWMMRLEDLRILVIEENAHLRLLINAMLRKLGVTRLYGTDNRSEGLSLLRDRQPDLMLVGQIKDGQDGITFIRYVRAKVDRQLPIIIVAGYSDLWRLGEAKKAGASEFLVKPFTAPALGRRILRASSPSRILDDDDRRAARIVV